MAVPFSTSDASELLEPGLKTIFLNKFRRFPEEYTKWINVLGSTRNFEEDLTFAALGSVPEKAEGASVVFDAPVQGSLKQYNTKEYALGFRITRPMWMDDQYGKIKTMTSALAISFNHLAEVQAAALLNNSTSTATEYLLADSKALIANDHALIRGGTFSNMPSSHTDFSYVAMQNALIHFDTLNDHSGFPILVQPEQVILHPNFRHIGEEVLKQEAKPNTADRDDNTVSNKGVSMFISHYLTDTDAWFVRSAPSVDGNAGHSAQFIWRERPIFETYDDKDTKDVKATGYCRFSRGVTEAFGWYGSTGA